MLLRHAALLCVVGFALGCSEGGPDDAGLDAGRDAGDAGLDAGRDAGIDARFDAGVDAWLDGPPWDPGWVRLPDLPDHCPIERAEHPERIVRAHSWEPCAEQPVGCRRGQALGIATSVGWYDAERERGYVFLVGPDNIDMIVDLDRGPIAAWRNPDDVGGDGMVCFVSTLGIGDGYAAAYMIYRDFRVDGRNLDVVYHAPLDEIGDTDVPFRVISPGLGDQPAQLAVTRSLVAAQMNTAALVVGFAPGRWGAIYAEPVVGAPQEIAALGDFAFWEDFNGPVRIAYGSLDRPAAWLRDIAPGSIRNFGTDGVDLAWVEIRDSPLRFDLWTAPVVFDAPELRPRRIGPISEFQFSGVGGGWFAHIMADPERLELVDLETGRTKSWLAPVGDRFIRDRGPIYVSATEILVVVPGGIFVRLDPRELPWDP